MVEKIIDILEKGNLSIPSILFFRYKELNMDLDELYLMTYLLNVEDKNYNPKKIAEELGMKMVEVMEAVDKLSGKDFLNIEVITVGKMSHEIIRLDGLYQKLAFIIVNDEKEVVDDMENQVLFDRFESEFGRPLSPIEYELISAWQDGVYEEEIIVAALKEAVYNGVTNIRYIDRILTDWHKKGIKTIKDIEKEKKNFQTKKEEKKNVFEYDWLNDTSE